MIGCLYILITDFRLDNRHLSTVIFTLSTVVTIKLRHKLEKNAYPSRLSTYQNEKRDENIKMYNRVFEI